MIIRTNMMAQGVLTQYKANQRNITDTAGKLASGYRIRMAADNAAGLQISEGMRSQIRGLMRAARNAEEGAGFIRTGDGAMNEIASILQRMRELCVQSSNDTYTNEDRAMMQMEFDQLQGEIDRINDQTEYNTLPVFEHYADTYYTYEGNRYWAQDQLHKITDDNNSLTVKYHISEDEPEKEMVLQIPNGTYTTQELIDAMDDVVNGANGADGLYLEYTREGFCNMVLQNGENINDISGGLSYLFFDAYGGSEAGMLIGTTEFYPGYPLKVNNQNNELSFKIEYYTGAVKDINIIVPVGSYSRQQMIDYLNTQLAGTNMQAMEHGDYCIKIGGDDGIITGIKGNMFKIDDPKTETVMSSVFYDNTKYGKVNKTASVFKGGAVLNISDVNADYAKLHITDANNQLSLKADADSGSYHTLTLDNGEYTIAEMRQQLQNKIDAAGLRINVTQHSSTVSTANGNRITFYGLTLTSSDKGKEFAIEFDKSASSAYDTLFVNRRYTDEADKVNIKAGEFSNSAASLTGGKIFTDDKFPMEIDDTNNTFILKVKEKDIVTGQTTSTDYKISISKKVYNNISDIITEIDNAINGTGAPVGLKDKIMVQNSGQRIQFVNNSMNKSVTGITFAETSSKGYKDLFVGSKTTVSAVTANSGSSRNPSIILDGFTEPISFDSDKSLTVNAGGNSYTATVPAGNYTKDGLADKITEQLKGSTTISPKSYSASGKGTTTDHSQLTYSAVGRTSTPAISCNVRGTGTPIQGTTLETNTTPATYTIPSGLSDFFEVRNGATTFNIAINGNNYSVDVAEGNYTPESLAQALQSALDDATKLNEEDRIRVTANSNKLTFTTVYEGSSKHLKFNITDSPLLYELYTTKTAASRTIDLPLENSIVIDSLTNTFTCSVDGTAQTVTIANGTYTAVSFADALNAAFVNNNVKARAFVNSGRLVLTTQEANGTASAISYSTANGGTSCEVLFGELIHHEPAKATISTPLLSIIDIKSGENKFTVRTTDASGILSDISVVIPEGNYTPGTLTDTLNSLFSGKGIEVSQSGGKLTFTTTEKGEKVTILVNNIINGSDSASKAMFGENTVTTPDIKASFTSDGKLKLSGSDTGSRYSMTVSSDTSPDFLKPVTTTTSVEPTAVAGSLTATYFNLKSGNNLGRTVKIEDYDTDFQFKYRANGVETPVSIILDEGEYTTEQLREMLQNKIDEKLGSDELTVSINSNGGITITANHYGKEYAMSDITGGFYKYILQGTAERESLEIPSQTEGKQVATDTYIIGRKEVKGTEVKITEHLTDEFGMELSIAGILYKLNIKISPGTYSDEKLMEELQTQINKQLEANGLPENCVLVGIGKFNSGVVGNSDENALNFYINPDINLPEGEYRIDALTGNALFEFFYKTEGELIPAYITGARDISGGVVIGNDETELQFYIDNIQYSYSLQPGDYSAEEFLNMLNDTLQKPDKGGNIAPLYASMSGNSVKLAFEKLGIHNIHDMGGSAVPAFFTKTGGRKDYSSELNIQVGANSNQMVALKKYSMSTISMGINSLVISKRKNAQKALRRIDEAIAYMSLRRSAYGAKENRIEHVIRGNENTAENLQAAESKLRDADMAEEIVTSSRQHIIQQAQIAMMVQANSANQTVLNLLEV